MNPMGKEADGPTPQTEMDALLLGRTNVSFPFHPFFTCIHLSFIINCGSLIKLK